MNKTQTLPQCYESEAYNDGWIWGYDALVVHLHEGFAGNMPKWLLSLIGGKKTVAEALRLQETEEIDENSMEGDYELGANDGYGELLDDIQAAYKDKTIDMPPFLQRIIGEPE